MSKKFTKAIIFLFVVVGFIWGTTSIILNLTNKHVCQAGNVLSYDDNMHFYKCKIATCDKRFKEEEHNLTWIIDKEETCEENGVKHQKCDCGYVCNIGTIIDDFKYDNNIQLKDNLTRKTYINQFDDGNHSPILELDIGYFEGERNNTSFTARFQRATYLSGEYISGNAKNDSLTFDFPGFTIYNNNGDSYTIRLRLSPKSDIPYAFEIETYTNGVYRLESEEITALCKDYEEKGFLNVDFGVYVVENIGLVYGFRFKTANYEISYLSNETGTLKSNTKFVKWLDSTIVSSEKYALNDVLGFIAINGIYNKDGSALKVSSRVWTGAERYGTLVTCNSASTWLMNRISYMVWQNTQALN